MREATDGKPMATLQPRWQPGGGGSIHDEPHQGRRCGVHSACHRFAMVVVRALHATSTKRVEQHVGIKVTETQWAAVRVDVQKGPDACTGRDIRRE